MFLTANAFACRGNRALPPASAVCLFDPRHLPPLPISDLIFADNFESP